MQRVWTQIGTLLWGLRQKSHTPRQRARKNQNQGLFTFWPTYRFSREILSDRFDPLKIFKKEKTPKPPSYNMTLSWGLKKNHSP